MGKTAESKLERAKYLNKMASDIRQKDADSARELDDLARGQRKAAIKQLKRRPKRRQPSSSGVLGA